MNDDLHNIDDLFKKALEKHTELPSSAVWDNIDKRLDKKKVISISKKYNKLKWAAAALLLFSFGIAMYTLHIRSKNKELVKQHNAGKDFKDQKKPTKKTPEDSANLSKKNDTGTEKLRINKQVNTKNRQVTGINENDIPKNKNTADNVNRRNERLPYNTKKILFPEEKTGANITSHSEKQLLKEKAAEKIPNKPAGTDLPDIGKEKVAESIVSGNDKDSSIDRGKERKLHNGFVSLKEKYFNKIPLIPELKDVVQTHAVKPVLQIPQLTTNTTMTLKDKKASVLKYGRGLPLKQHYIKKGSSALSLELFFSPDLVSTNVKNNHPLFREEDRHEIEKDEKTKSSYTTGMLIAYNMGGNWSLESGITFSTRFTDIEPKTIYARPDNNGHINYRFNCSGGYSFVMLNSAGRPPVSGDSINALTSKNVLQYIGVPLAVKYKSGKGRLGVTAGVGISANFLTKAKIETTIPTLTGDQSLTSNDIRGLRSIYFAGLASLGAQYKLNKTFELTFIPTIRFALSSISRNAPVKTYLNSIGLSSGIIIKL